MLATRNFRDWYTIFGEVTWSSVLKATMDCHSKLVLHSLVNNQPVQLSRLQNICHVYNSGLSQWRHICHLRRRCPKSAHIWSIAIFTRQKVSRQNTHFQPKISRQKCLSRTFPARPISPQAINILAGNEHFNRRELLCAFWRQRFVAGIAFGGKYSRYALLAGNCWRQMWISAVKHYDGKIPAMCIFRIFSLKLYRQNDFQPKILRAMNIFARIEHFNRR